MKTVFEKDGVRVEEHVIGEIRQLFVCYDGHDLGVFPVRRLTQAIDWAVLVASKPRHERQYWLH